MEERLGVGPGDVAGDRLTCDDRVAAAFDVRLSEVWLEVFASGAELSEASDYVACFLRMAYLHGYQDGLCEVQRGSLYASLGLAVPDRRTISGRERKERRA